MKAQTAFDARKAMKALKAMKKLVLDQKDWYWLNTVGVKEVLIEYDGDLKVWKLD